MFSTTKSGLLGESHRIHLNTTEIENILLPWVVLGLITYESMYYFFGSAPQAALTLVLPVPFHTWAPPGPPPQPGAVSPCPSEAVGVLGFSYPQPCPVTGLTQPGPHMDLYSVLAWTCLAWTSRGQSPTPGDLRCPRASCCHAPDGAEGRALAAGPALVEPWGAPIVPAGPWHWQIQVMWYWAFFPQKDTPC